MAFTKTDTKLALSHTHLGWRITAPEMPPIELGSDYSFCDCATAAGLTNGYWLRDTNPEPGVTTWTWVQL